MVSDPQLRRDQEVSILHMSARGLSMGARYEQDSLRQTLALEKAHICLVRFEVSGCCGEDRDNNHSGRGWVGRAAIGRQGTWW